MSRAAGWVVTGPPGSGKLASFEAFTARMRPGTPPPVPHFAVDNRLAAPVPLEAQLDGLPAG